mgnify:FL=1
MKAQRQAKILEIIASGEVQTQEEILQQLRDLDYNCTQATISRDMKELRIVKKLASDGSYRYATSMNELSDTFTSRLNTIFRECVISFEAAQNIVVIKTLPGLANAACSTVDGMEIDGVVGTLAGDDTGILIMRDSVSALAFCDEIKTMLR